MRDITIFYDGSHYLYRWLKPMMQSRRQFEELGYKVHYHCIKQYLPIFKSGEQDNLNYMFKGNYDIIFLAFHHSTSELCLCDSENRISILKKIKKHCKTLVWCDTADSAGCGMFDVMPYVDIYFKKQVYNDKNLYLRPLYGSRLFCDFYHQLLNVEDSELTKKKYPLLAKQYIDKIQISWNVGLADLFVKGYKLLLHPFSVALPDFVAPDSSNKDLDLHFRGSGWSPIAGYQRTRCKELVSKLDSISHPDVNSQVPYKEYIAEIKRAKAVLSPFGWGEICGRDFEALAYGATLIKPSMDHCNTYPDWYQAGKTYVPLKWDFSDFDVMIHELGSERYKEIAKNGFAMFKYYKTSVNARKEFAMHIIKGLKLEQ